MKEFIYIVGKGDPQRATVEAIRRAGYQVGLLHDNARQLKDRQPYDAILEIDFNNLNASLTGQLKTLGIKGLLCTYENYIIAKATIAAYLGLPSLSVASAKLSTDKLLMRMAFSEYDTTISPAFQMVDSLDAGLEFAANHGYPVIIKPANLVKSLLVLRCNDETELRANLSYAQEHVGRLYVENHIYDRQPQLIIEQFVTGKLCSVAAYVDHTGQPHLCDGIAGLVNATEVGYDDNFLYSRTLPARLEPALEQRITETADKAVRALGLRSSPAHVELIYDEAGNVTVIEVGARTGGYRPRMYKLSYGIDLAAQEVALALGEIPEVSGTFQTYSAVYELFPKQEGSFVAVAGSDSDPALAGYTYYSLKAKPGQKVGQAKAGFRATAVIIVSHENYDEFRRLCASAERLHVEVA